MIPIHPQPSPDRADELRWITPARVLPFAGRVAKAPEPLAALLDDGTLTEVRVEASAVVTRLGPGRVWPDEGPRVRTALHAALEEPANWSPTREQPDGDQSGDALLRAAAQALLDGSPGGAQNGSVGRFARSHGGRIELLGVRDGVVEVQLGGTCDGCPAARVTLQVRLEQELRQQFPGLREVRNSRKT